MHYEKKFLSFVLEKFSQDLSQFMLMVEIIKTV